EVFYVCAPGLALTGDVKICSLAIADEKFLSWLQVLPAHFAWSLKPEDSAFGTLHTRAQVTFLKICPQRSEMIVVLIHPFCDLVNIRRLGYLWLTIRRHRDQASEKKQLLNTQAAHGLLLRSKSLGCCPGGRPLVM